MCVGMCVYIHMHIYNFLKMPYNKRIHLLINYVNASMSSLHSIYSSEFWDHIEVS